MVAMLQENSVKVSSLQENGVNLYEHGVILSILRENNVNFTGIWCQFYRKMVLILQENGFNLTGK